MYLPPHFAEHDTPGILDFIRRHSFGTLVSQHNGAPFASHLPFLIEPGAPETRPTTSLLGHMARANPQWMQAEGQNVLAIFSGPHAYISPSWYATENMVPTWNYAAVHAIGVFHAIHDPAQLLDLVAKTVDVYESPREQPWAFDAKNEFYKKLVNSVVGFRLEITKLEGKFKLNQNHPPERRERVIQALDASPNPDDKAIARLMKEHK
ncbi:MAG TPA: FMN-binding negative transcriptional regulator [Planctomycetota bacterium]|nr:FMN-binding negative transcriptional regulator [Planctomycetota bacterium]